MTFQVFVSMQTAVPVRLMSSEAATPWVSSIRTGKEPTRNSSASLRMLLRLSAVFELINQTRAPASANSSWMLRSFLMLWRATGHSFAVKNRTTTLASVRRSWWKLPRKSSRAKSGTSFGAAAEGALVRTAVPRRSARMSWFLDGMLKFGLVEALHGGLHFLDGGHEGVLGLLVGIAVGMVDQGFDALHQFGGALLQAGDLFFPDEFLAGAGEEIFEVGDVVLGGGAAGVALVHA